jgi:hypothetical protein
MKMQWRDMVVGGEKKLRVVFEETFCVCMFYELGGFLFLSKNNAGKREIGDTVRCDKEKSEG